MNRIQSCLRNQWKNPTVYLVLLLTFCWLITGQNLAYATEPDLSFTDARSAEKIAPELLTQLLAPSTFDAADPEDLKNTYRVIVSLDSPLLPQSMTFDGAGAERSQRSSIQLLQQSVISAVVEATPKGFEELYRYDSIAGFSARVSPVALAQLISRDEVVYIEEMRVFEKQDAEAHAITNTTAAHALGATGAGVTIAIIDDGIQYTHPAFGGQGSFPNAKVLGGFDFADNDSDPGNDCAGQSHGTQVSGVAAGNGGGVLGTAPDANIVFLKIQSAGICGSTSLDGDIVASVDWAITNRTTHNIKVVSLSLGGSSYSSACDSASSSYTAVFAAAQNAGIVAIAASGNDAETAAISFPACISTVTSVGATYDANLGSASFGICSDQTTQAKKVTCYSNSANILDILAPAHCATTSTTGSAVANCFGGTSSATPYAAGIAATLFSVNTALSDTDVVDIIKNTGEPVTDARNNISKPFVQHLSAIEAANSATSCTAPTNIAPANGSTLASGSQLLSWDNTNCDYWVYAGTTSDSNAYDDSGNLGNVTSYTFDGYPSDGSIVRVTVFYKPIGGGGWQTVVLNYTAPSSMACVAPTGITPSAGSTLSTGSTVISWDNTNCDYWVYAGTSAGNNAYDDSSNIGNTTSYTINGYPADGSDVVVTLYYRPLTGGSWLSTVLTYSAPSSTACVAPTGITPSAGSTLSTGSTVISWDNTNCDYWVYAGTSAGNNAYDNSSNIGNTTSYTINGYPADGSDVVVTLYYRPLTGGSWLSTVMTYSAPSSTACVVPTGIAPSAGSTLSTGSTVISWDNTNCDYWVYAGTASDSNAYDDSGNLGNATSYAFDGYPSDGSAVRVTLFYRVIGSGSWQNVLITYNAPSNATAEFANTSLETIKAGVSQASSD